MNQHMKKIMIIGGTDSSGGAGVTRDAFVAHRLGYELAPVVTAVTAQSNSKLYQSEIMPPVLVRGQIEAGFQVHRPDALKIGMLGSREIAETVADAILGYAGPVVLDPVVKSSSGGVLLSGNLPRSLLERTTLITPNLTEAAALTQSAIAMSEQALDRQAQWFLEMGVGAVLLKGGHAHGETCTDYLFERGNKSAFPAPRLNAETRGTGCALATAIACHLAEGMELARACAMSKELVFQLIKAQQP